MGNCCSGSSGADRNDDPFSKPGRTLSEAPPRNPQASAAVPKNRMGNNGSKQSARPGHTLGDSAAPTRTQPDPSMRSAAAKAAEERAKKAQGTGQLGKKLDLQKRQTQTGTLEAASQAERSARVQDTSATSQAYN